MSLARRSRRRRFADRGSVSESLETRCLLSRITVTSAADNLVEDGEVTLREAILAANTNRSVDGSAAGQFRTVDVIEFAESLNGQTITLSEGQLRVTSDMMLEGGGIVIDANSASRHFGISGTNVDFTISDSTLRNGHAASGGAIARTTGRGGSLSIINSTLSGNRSNNEGGAIHAENPEGGFLLPFELTITGSTFDDNSAVADGGALYAYGFGETLITDSVFSQNHSEAHGGAVSIGDSTDSSTRMSVQITRTEFDDNRATDDGGAAHLSATGKTRIDASVFTDNSTAMNGGGDPVCGESEPGHPGERGSNPTSPETMAERFTSASCSPLQSLSSWQIGRLRTVEPFSPTT